MGSQGLCFCLAAALATARGSSQASAIAGHFQVTAGDVRMHMPDGTERPPHKGAAINVGETVVADPHASAQLLMLDDVIIALRPDPRLDVAVYRYAM